MKQDSLSKKKRKQRFALAAICVLFAGILAYTALKPESEMEQADDLKDSLLDILKRDDELFLKNQKRSPEENQRRRKALKKIRTEIKKLSPETRKKLTVQLIKSRLDQLREKTDGMSDDEKRDYINDLRKKINDKFDKMSDKERDKIKDRINSDKGKEEMRNALDTYYNSISAKDKELYDPLVMDMLENLNSL
jgi:hypothetical protein